MKITEEKLKERADYAAWLSKQLDELRISKSDLGKAVGKSPVTVRGYANGVSMPKEKTKAAIAAYIKERSVCNNFNHLPSEKFSLLLRTMLAEFDVTESELAEKIGKYQKNISNYIWEAEKADTETQYHILQFFLALCETNNGRVFSEHAGTYLRLVNLLENGYLDDNEYDLQTLEPEALAPSGTESGEKFYPSSDMEYLLSLPAKLQGFIIDHFAAFFDNCVPTTWVSYSFDFEMRKNYMELFRGLSEQDKKQIVSKLEKCTLLGYPKTDDEWWFYKQITAYRNVIYTNLQKLKQDDCFLSEQNKGNYIKAYESVISLAIASDKEVVEEVKYKLTFTRYEWYIWMLFLISEFKGNDLNDIFCKMI